ncbi:Tcp11-domain-containing protein [Ophiobolus disseminans]|uniref:Tcp11-domain-containing protein n=1 Tax=Ophiobolus disseminans TaxID=1469910 RepID=A0A6A7ALP6_9PLEO|nr:Tcp11-domain-containing protein [Ophiobolus disseminans]
MDAHTSKASSSKASRLSYSKSSTTTLITEGSIDRSTPAWQMTLVSRDGPSLDKRYIEEHASRSEASEAPTSRDTYPPPPASSTLPTSSYRDIPEELSQILISMPDSMLHPRRGEELAEAFREASTSPPITKHSLSELDIQNIITNTRLRHDVNFDRDLSFRPNLDGARGHTKQQKTDMYWVALVAELQLYAGLFQNTTSPRKENDTRWMDLVNNAKRRIPAMFQAIKEILKSLVPDRDHPRVDEHLDVPMLMQEIERGVCDLVRLAEWMAQLLKEHCAPMRDGWVDNMVNLTKTGVANGSLEMIVEGLRELFGILETMKLDVANHQIRNLKTLLIEDSVNFEKHYHLDRLVNHRSRVNIGQAQRWYLDATHEFTGQHPEQPRNAPQIKLEIFVRAVIAELFNKDEHRTFPGTFYLDEDRLRALKTDIEDLIYMEVCMDAFVVLLKDLGHNGSVSSSIRQHLHTSLLAIMGDTLGYGSQQWLVTSEALSLELLRQASQVTGQAVSYSHGNLSLANDLLVAMFQNSSATHDSRLEITLLLQVLSCTNRNTNSTPMDMFNNLVSATKTVSSLSTPFLHLQPTYTSTSPDTLSPESTQWQDIANRISHIVLLHWRIWHEIAYVQEDGSERSLAPSTTTSSTSPLQPIQHATYHATEQDAQMVTAMKTGEVAEPGPDTHVAHETSSQ